MDRAVHTYKARLVAKGYTQTPEIDYEETFSPVADIRAIRILIAIAAFYDYEIWQMDIKTAFFNGYLSEEVYMEQLEGFVNPKFPNRDVKSYLGRCFAMKDLGEATYILGIKIYRDRSKRLIGLYQSAYIEKILKRYFMENSKRGSIPMQEKLKLSRSQGASTPSEVKPMQNVPYASAVGSIMYVVRCTRPDVAFAQNITSRFQQNPGELHWTAVKNILKYLRNTKDMFLVYRGDIKRELKVSCYTDAGYLTDADDLKSQTGYVFVLNGDASKEAVWVRKFISGLGVVPTIEEPIKMYCDNIRAITIANESGITKGARHYHAKVHYLRKVIEFGDHLGITFRRDSANYRPKINRLNSALERIIIWINQFHYLIQVARVGCHTLRSRNTPAETRGAVKGLVPSVVLLQLVATYSLNSCFKENSEIRRTDADRQMQIQKRDPNRGRQIAYSDRQMQIQQRRPRGSNRGRQRADSCTQMHQTNANKAADSDRQQIQAKSGRTKTCS
ncbi:retrotransposon protein, putative, ty1-copia subclass [Tanacetum coccineum]